jgi:hypothetical protein
LIDDYEKVWLKAKELPVEKKKSDLESLIEKANK